MQKIPCAFMHSIIRRMTLNHVADDAQGLPQLAAFFVLQVAIIIECFFVALYILSKLVNVLLCAHF